MEQVRTILKAEEAFAREVALGVVVTRPLKSWLYLIPGMFMVDFLRRQAAIRRYVTHYMTPRRQGLKSAQSILNGTEEEVVRADTETQIGVWMAAQGHNHSDLVNVQMALAELLQTHFSKLLASTRTNYYDMVRSAYENRMALRQMLDRLSELEFQRDRLINSSSNNDKISLEATQGQVVMRRNRLIDAIY